MPSYNQGRYIEEAILSILRQGPYKVQLIIMDGGSADDTVSVVQRHADHVSVFRSERDRGQSHALNKALALATAPVVGWLNSDDRYQPGAFARVLKAFAARPEVVLVHGNRIMIDAHSRTCGWSSTGPFRPQDDVYNICSETAFWRRNASEGLSFREDLRFAMDVHFLGSLSKRGEIEYLPAFLGAFRCHPDSKSSTIWDEVAVPEGREVWRELFGRVPRSTPPAKASSWTLMRELAANPLSIGWGYLLYRAQVARDAGAPAA